MKERGSSIGTAIMTRGISAPRVSFGERSFAGPNISASNGFSTSKISEGVTLIPGTVIRPLSSGLDKSQNFNINNLGVFNPNRAVVTDQQVGRFNIKNVSEFQANFPTPTANHDKPNRRRTHHRRLSTGSAGGFRPLNFSTPKRANELGLKDNIIPAPQANADKVVNTIPVAEVAPAFRVKVNIFPIRPALYPNFINKPDEIKLPKFNGGLIIKNDNENAANTSSSYDVKPKNERVVEALGYGEASRLSVGDLAYVRSRRLAPLEIPKRIKKVTKDEEEEAEKQSVITLLKKNSLKSIEQLKKSTIPTIPDIERVNKAVVELRPTVGTKKELLVVTKPVIKTPVITKNEIAQQPKETSKIVQNKTAQDEQAKTPEEETAEIDTPVNEARLEELMNAKRVVEEESRLLGVKASWRDVAKLLPAAPTEPLTSSIVKTKKVNGRNSDGSWTELLGILPRLGVIFPKQKPESIIRSNTAVRIGEKGEEATKSEIRKVLGTDRLEKTA